MKAKDLIPKPWLATDDVSIQGIDVRIRSFNPVVMQKLHTPGKSEPEIKPVLYFDTPGVKPMVLNATKITATTVLHGEDTEDWAGKPIRLIRSMTTMAGKPVACIMVVESSGGMPETKAAAVNSAQPQPQDDDSQDDIPF